MGGWRDAFPWRDGARLRRGQPLHLRARPGTAQVRGHPSLYPTDIEVRYRYNQDFKSIYAMVPAVIPLLLIFIPAILMALGVVREKELGSITNLYVTPVTRLEFLLGNNCPMWRWRCSVSMPWWPRRCSSSGCRSRVALWVLSAAALPYVVATTGLGLLMSIFTRTQIAALAATAIITMLPTVGSPASPTRSRGSRAWGAWSASCGPPPTSWWSAAGCSQGAGLPDHVAGHPHAAAVRAGVSRRQRGAAQEAGGLRCSPTSCVSGSRS